MLYIIGIIFKVKVTSHFFYIFLTEDEIKPLSRKVDLNVAASSLNIGQQDDLQDTKLYF